MPARVGIIIVNYRTPALALQCLSSLAQDASISSQAQVIVVDNASGDQSFEMIGSGIVKEGWGGWVTLLKADENRGFSAGNNLALKYLLKTQQSNEMPYILLLNPDTMPRPGAVRELTSFMDGLPAAGIVGACLLNSAGARECAAHHFPSPMGELEAMIRLGMASRILNKWRVSPPIRENAHECDWVSGAALMIRRSVLERVGLLDEGFFLYFEEVDWCRRAKSAGWQVWYVPQAEVVHLEGASTLITQKRIRRTKHWFDSRRRYFKKHMGRIGLIAADLCWSIGWFGNYARWLLSFGIRKNMDAKYFAWDLIVGDLRNLWSRV